MGDGLDPYWPITRLIKFFFFFFFLIFIFNEQAYLDMMIIKHYKPNYS